MLYKKKKKKEVSFILNFKRSPCSECYIFIFGCFPGVIILYADVSEQCVSSNFISDVIRKYFLLTPPMKMEQTEYSKKFVNKILTPRKYPKVGTQQVSFSVDKKNQLDVTFCILYFSSNSCSTCFGQPCAHHQELTTA